MTLRGRLAWVLDHTGERLRHEALLLRQGAHERRPCADVVRDALREARPLERRPFAGEARVVLLLPTLSSFGFFGGAATALLLADRLASATGRELHIAQTLAPGAVQPDLEALALHSRVTVSDVSRSRRLALGEGDLCVASAWWDARSLDRLAIGPYVYLVQDDEPAFYPVGDRSALASSTYSSRHALLVCNTELVRQHMLVRGFTAFERACAFEPAVSLLPAGGVRPSVAARPSDPLKVFFYARPSVDRNLFHLGLLALQKAVELDAFAPDTVFVMAGEASLSDVELAPGVVLRALGNLSFSEYRNLVASSDVALTPMAAPHPNYPTLECASLGCAVVTTAFSVKQDLVRYSENILCVDTSVDAMAEGLREAAGWPRELRMERRARQQISSDWDDALRQVTSTVLDEIGTPAAEQSLVTTGEGPRATQ